MPIDSDELRGLARDVLAVLRAQRGYFDTHRDDPAKRDRLRESQALERAIKARAEAVLVPPAPGLFDGQEGAGS